MSAEILATKLFIPPLRPDVVPRPHLVERLHTGMKRKLTLLSTPAGFGKTTLLCEWIERRRIPAAWISLDAGDNAQGRFLTYLAAALQLSIETPWAQAWPIEFINRIAAHAPQVLILDDYHVIHEQTMHDTVIFLIEHMPPQLHLVIATRTDPPFPLGQLRARQQLNEFHAHDLRFSRAEAARFLNEIAALELSDAHVAALEQRTEGWIAGLQLASLALTGRSDAGRFVQSFVGSHRYVLDYLADEVLDRQPEPVQTFLLKTSILERMTAGLCTALTDQAGGQAMLDMLERENMFIVPLDDERRWYRYHQLFSDLLRFRLQTAMPALVGDLHRRAAAWYTRNGQAYEALGHALAAHDHALALRIVQEASPVLAMRGDMNTLLDWLDSLPKNLAGASPNLWLIRGWAHLFMLDIGAVESDLQQVLPVVQAARDLPAPEADSILGQINALQAFVEVYRGNPEHAIELALDALKRLPESEMIGRYAVYAALGDAYRDLDDFALASHIYGEAVKSFARINQPIASQAIHMDLARLVVKMGQAQQAEEICQQVLAESNDPYHPSFPAAQAAVLLGDILRERNELQKAHAVLTAGIQQCRVGGYARYLVTGHIVLGRVYYAQRNLGAMEQALAAAAQAARESGVESLSQMAALYRVRLSAYADAETWAQNFETKLQAPPNIRQEEASLTLTRILAKSQNKAALKKGLALLEKLQSAANRSERVGSLIEIKIVQALTLYAQGRVTEALATLNHALRLAEPQGYVRLFVDEGAAMAELLRIASRSGAQREYAGRLLKIMQTAQAPAPPPLSEALTEREIEILRLIDAGLSNQQIAQALCVSLSTVKTHVTHLLGKLGAASRTQAVVLGRERGLL